MMTVNVTVPAVKMGSGSPESAKSNGTGKEAGAAGSSSWMTILMSMLAGMDVAQALPVPGTGPAVAGDASADCGLAVEGVGSQEGLWAAGPVWDGQAPGAAGAGAAMAGEWPGLVDGGAVGRETGGSGGLLGGIAAAPDETTGTAIAEE